MLNIFSTFITACHVYNRMYKTLKSIEKFNFNRRLAWREMQLNYKVRKTYPVRIISVGSDCLVRTLLTNWMLKTDRRCGEKGMLFDRTLHSAKVAAFFLEKDFAGYFDTWRYNPAPELNCWFNMSMVPPDTELPVLFKKARGSTDFAFYYHDHDCGPNDMEKIKKRTERRLNLFRDTLVHPRENDLYVINKSAGDTQADVEKVCRLIRKKRGTSPTHILVFITDSCDTVEKIDGVTTIRCLYPYEYSSWGNPKVYKRLHVFFFVKFVRACRQYILDTFPVSPGKK